MMSYRNWRAGFEVELILGDLGIAEFEREADEPMDEASSRYCRAVARLGLVTVSCRSPISLSYLGFECERADATQI